MDFVQKSRLFSCFFVSKSWILPADSSRSMSAYRDPEDSVLLGKALEITSETNLPCVNLCETFLANWAQIG